MSDEYHVGDIWEAEDALSDPRTSAPVDPTELLFSVRKPDLTSGTYSVTRLDKGVYVARVPLTQAGSWIGVWTSPTGQYQGVGKTSILVMP